MSEHQRSTVPTKERLAERLRKEGLNDLADRALKGEFSDYEGESATPKVDLIREIQLRATAERWQRLKALIDEVINGDFDDTKEEAEAWFEKEGKNLLREGKATIQ